MLLFSVPDSPCVRRPSAISPLFYFIHSYEDGLSPQTLRERALDFGHLVHNGGCQVHLMYAGQSAAPS
jgi:hypothetical protein